MKYFFLPVCACGLALARYTLALGRLGWMWGVFPLWHLRWPCPRDFPLIWVSRAMLLEQWPREFRQRARGRYRPKKKMSFVYY